MSKRIVIHDTVHGSITLDACASRLLGTPEVRRLAGIKQLGLTYLVFPGANHTRLEHSIGTYHIAKNVAASLDLDKKEGELVSYAALLHDLGHGPFSHTLEGVLHESLGIDHMKLTKDIIVGEKRTVSDDIIKTLKESENISDILNEFSVSPEAVGNLVCGNINPAKGNSLFSRNGQQFFNEKTYLTHIVHGPIDCDQIDYLLRDAHYTGVAHGTIDLARLLQTLTIHNNDLVINEKGLSAVEGMLVARSLMYSSVYFHKTVRICELMLAKAVKMALKKEKLLSIQMMNDAELLNWLYSLGGFQRETVQRLKFRMLYKTAFGKRIVDLTEDEQERLLEITRQNSWPAIEKSICQRSGLNEGDILIDIPESDLLISEPRITRTDINVLAEGKVKSLSKVTPFTKAIQQKNISRWAFLVACEKKNVQNVAKSAKKLIFD